MSSLKKDCHDLGNGWGWFVSIDYNDEPKKEIYMPKIHRLKSIRSMKSVTNLHEYYENKENETNQNYSVWGINAFCVLFVMATIGFVIL